MKTENQSTTGFDSRFILDALMKHRKHLIIVAVASVMASVIFSSEFFIKPKYKSTAVVYPSNLIPYSTESATEQMLQLFESQDIRDKLAIDFQLMSHYEIDSTAKAARTYLLMQMDENIRIDKTKYESVEIQVWDTDPVYARNMADSLISYLDQLARSIQRKKTQEVVVIYQNQMDLKKAEMDSMEAALKMIREQYGILEYENQVRSFSRIYYGEMAGGRAGSGNSKNIDKVMNNLESKGGDFISLTEHLWRVRGNYNDIKEKYEDALKDLTKVLTYSSLITSPELADKKSYPIRSLIVLMFTGSMLLLAAFIIVVTELRKQNAA